MWRNFFALELNETSYLYPEMKQMFPRIIYLPTMKKMKMIVTNDTSNSIFLFVISEPNSIENYGRLCQFLYLS